MKRDLAWLFNTTNFEVVQDLSEYPEVKRSVVNFGLPSLAGRTASSVRPEDLEDAFRQAVLDFEPRLIRSSVRITLEKQEEMNHNALVFTISADLWAQPLPLHILLRSQLDLESGHVEVLEAGASEAP